MCWVSWWLLRRPPMYGGHRGQEGGQTVLFTLRSKSPSLISGAEESV